jgi:hypothetical protein
MQSCASPGVDERRCLLLVVLPFGGGRWGTSETVGVVRGMGFGGATPRNTRMVFVGVG